MALAAIERELRQIHADLDRKKFEMGHEREIQRFSRQRQTEIRLNINWLTWRLQTPGQTQMEVNEWYLRKDEWSLQLQELRTSELQLEHNATAAGTNLERLWREHGRLEDRRAAKEREYHRARRAGQG